MKRIYQAANAIEAHMILHLLQQSGIEGHIEGEYLQGGVGELPAVGLVSVVVADEQAAHAGAIIRDWERSVPPPRPDGPAVQPLAPMAWLVLGALIGGTVVWAFCKSLA